MANIEEKVENLLIGTIQKLGYDLYDVEYTKEGKDYFLRIFIDSEKGIDLNDCEKVNNEISDMLDKADYIKEQYFLEVSSPGIERVLRKQKHLMQNIGNEVEVKLFAPINNQKKIIGILDGCNEKTINIKTQIENIEIEKSNISLIKTIYNWE